MPRTKKNHEPEEKPLIEEYFLIRLPPEQAEHIRFVMNTKPKQMKKAFKIEFDADMKNAYAYIKNRGFEGQMVNLPTTLEVTKSTNAITMYKTGTISQMLIVEDELAWEKARNTYWPHGICNPMKNVRKQRFRKTMRNQEEVKEAADVQKEVSLLLRTDYEAVSSRFEIYYEPTPSASANAKITEESLFGVMSGSETESDSGNYDIIEFN